MTREEFMEIVYDELHSDGDNCRANRIIDAADEYAELDWIPVSERLPEADVDVLVTDNGGGVPTVIIDACGMKDDTGERFWYISQTPIAWMEWPEPYKADLPKYEAKVITRGNCMICGKKLDEGLFFCKECETKAESEEKS